MTTLRDRNKHTFLLIGLILLLVFSSFGQAAVNGLRLLDVVLALVMISAVYSTSRRRPVFIAAAILALLGLGATSASYGVETPILSVASQVSYVLLFLLTCASILSDVFRSEQVTFDKINGAVCVYLLIGVVFAIIYSMVESLSPGSFREAGVAATASGEDLVRVITARRFLYFSLVTLTTLGFGDITPLADGARVLTVLEAVLGQVYLTILVARLVGLHIAHASAPAS